MVSNTSAEKMQHRKSDVINPHPKSYHLEIPNDQKLQFVGILDDTNMCAAGCRPVVVEVHLTRITLNVRDGKSLVLSEAG